MMAASDENELAHFLRLYWHVEDGGPHLADELRSALDQLGDPERARRFKQQLARTIEKRDLTPRELERWTSLALDDETAVHEELRRAWRALYGRESPADWVGDDR